MKSIICSVVFLLIISTDLLAEEGTKIPKGYQKISELELSGELSLVVDPAGKILEELVYFMADDRRAVSATEIRAKIPYKDGRRSGVASVYHKGANKLAASVPFENGLVHGVVRYFSPSGDVIGQTVFENGTGVWLITGKRNDHWCVIGVTNFVQGTKSGVECVCDLMNGRTLVDCYRLGMPNGLSLSFGDDGTLRSKGVMTAGRLYGPIMKWNGQGELLDGYPKYFIDNREVTKEDWTKWEASNPHVPLKLPRLDSP